MTPRDLARRLASAEARTPRGPMVSTAFGAGESRPYQVGFPAELTSTFDASTGYSWKRLVLDPTVPEVGNMAIPQTGDMAFTPDNDQTLDSGARGWLELDPQAGGWIFVLTNSASGPAEGDCGPGSGWVARLSQWSCLKATVLEGSVTPTTLYLTYSVGGYTSDPDTMTYDLGSGFLTFGKSADPRHPTLTLDAKELFFDCAGEDDDGTPFLVFEGGIWTGHTADSVSDPGDACNFATFRIRIECVCCPVDGWDGDGWYCVVAEGGDCEVDTVSVVEILEDDLCDFDGVVCDGPYPTEAEATAACLPAPDGGPDCAGATDLGEPPQSWSGSVNAFSFQWWKFTIPTTGTYYFHWGPSDAATFSAAVYKGSDCGSKSTIATQVGTASGCDALALVAGDIVWVGVGNITGAAGAAAWSFNTTVC